MRTKSLILGAVVFGVLAHVVAYNAPNGVAYPVAWILLTFGSVLAIGYFIYFGKTNEQR